MRVATFPYASLGKQWFCAFKLVEKLILMFSNGKIRAELDQSELSPRRPLCAPLSHDLWQIIQMIPI